MRGGLRARMPCNGIISPALGPAATGYPKHEFVPSHYKYVSLAISFNPLDSER